MNTQHSLNFTSASGRSVIIAILSGHCVRIRIAPPKKENGPSLLERYGFITEKYEDSVPHFSLKDGRWSVESPNVKLEGSDDSFSASLPDGRLLLRMEHVSFHDDGTSACFTASPGEDWCGFGDQTRERIFHRGHQAHCQISDVTSYLPVPFFMSTLGYGILVNTTNRIDFDLCDTDPGRFSWKDGRDVLDFYLFIAPTFKELIRCYAELSGFPKLPPLWSFGLWYICRTQANDAEVLADALNFRRSGIPCDVIGLEPGWMEKDYDKSTGKEWSSQRFPLPEWQKKCEHTFIKALKRMGFHLELWLCNDYDLSLEEERRARRSAGKLEVQKNAFHTGDEKDEHLSHPIFLDSVTKRSEAWFEHLKKFVDWGADFFKQDGAWQVCDHPDRLFGNGKTDAEMHNLYPLCYSRQMYEGFAEYTHRRPVVFTVSGWTGFQCHCGTWTGDTGGRLETLGAMLNTAFLGHSWATNDMEVAQKEGIHFGYLLPWSQINSWTYFRMPWYQGKELFAMHLYYSRLRSRLVPYLYSWGRQSTVDAVPLMRPLALEFQDDPECRKIMHEYLLGRDLLVGIYRHTAYLPRGRWQDVWSGKIHSGGRTEEIQWPADRGGMLMLRENGIVPLGPVMQHYGETGLDRIEWRIFPGQGISDFDLYEDDGISFEFQNKKFSLMHVRMNSDDDGWSLQFDDSTAGRSHSLVAVLDECPREVTNNGEQAEWHYDVSRNELSVSTVHPGTVKIVRRPAAVPVS